MKPLYGEIIDKNDIKAEIKKGTRIAEATLCDEFLFHSYFFKKRYIRYSDIKKSYLELESSESGDFGVTENSLVIVDIADNIHKLHLDYKEYVLEILEYFKANCKWIAITKK